MKNLKRIFVIFIVALLVGGFIPVSAFAVDPVSAATMANAFAQAVTAYGASQGVSLTFDVTNTDDIGEGVHELWDQFKTDINDNNVPTYDSLAVTVWSTLFKKVGNNVAFNLSDTTVSYLDQFWNWLLTGPAEMTKVDNQYYEWTVDSVTNTIPPVSVFSNSYLEVNGFKFVPLPYEVVYIYNNDSSDYIKYSFSTLSGSLYFISNEQNTYIVSFASGASYQKTEYYSSNQRTDVSNITLPKKNAYLWSALSSGSNIGSYSVDHLPNVDSLFDLNTFASSLNSSTEFNPSNDTISVRPYVGDAIPNDRVYIPDNTDVNYVPVPAEIPIDVSWDDSLFGDGTGSLTDAQSEAATDAIIDAITQNPAKTLELAETADPPLPGTEVYTPLLPIELPEFNFSFSGIWHYVREWVGSIGSWLSMMFTVWSHLPYAISVPVYATAVIVIVLGVYKRFFM